MPPESVYSINSTDFTALIGREPRHTGLVYITVAHGLMSLEIQQRLFDYAMTKIADTDLAGQVVEFALKGVDILLYGRTPGTNRSGVARGRSAPAGGRCRGCSGRRSGPANVGRMPVGPIESRK